MEILVWEVTLGGALASSTVRGKQMRPLNRRKSRRGKPGGEGFRPEKESREENIQHFEEPGRMAEQ